MTRKTKKPAAAGKPGLRRGIKKPAASPLQPLASQGKPGGFSKAVRHIPLPGKSRGR